MIKREEAVVFQGTKAGGVERLFKEDGLDETAMIAVKYIHRMDQKELTLTLS